MHLNRSTILGFLAILLWSLSVAFARSISEKLGPLTTGAAVYIPGGIILLTKLLLTNGSKAKLKQISKRYLWFCGTLFIVYTIAFVVAVGISQNRQQTLEIGLLNYLWPTLTIIFSLFLLSKKASILLLPATLIAFLGIILVVTQGQVASLKAFTANLASNPAAYILAFTAAISWALYSTLTRRWGGNSNLGLAPLFILLSGIIFLILRLFNPEPANWNISVIIEIACLALATALGYLFWDISMRKGDILLVASASYLTPLLSTIVGTIYLKVLPGLPLWIGCILIITGSFLSYRSIRNHKTG